MQIYDIGQVVVSNIGYRESKSTLKLEDLNSAIALFIEFTVMKQLDPNGF